MTQTFEACQSALQQLIDDESLSGKARNEATTRLQVIDRLLFEALGWQRSECIAEERFEGQFTDYTMISPNRLLIVEAKREGIYFELPLEERPTPLRPIRYFERNNRPTFDAIQQCMAYCQQRGAPFGAVANGHQIVAFVASRSDVIPAMPDAPVGSAR